jgi:hypothetical protein
MIVTQRSDAVLDSTADDRARLVVRMAIRAFGDGVRGADWLVQPNDELGANRRSSSRRRAWSAPRACVRCSRSSFRARLARRGRGNAAHSRRTVPSMSIVMPTKPAGLLTPLLRIVKVN